MKMTWPANRRSFVRGQMFNFFLIQVMLVPRGLMLGSSETHSKRQAPISMAYKLKTSSTS